MDEVAIKLEPKTLELFLYIAGEAQHWDWMPPIEGLMPFSNEDKGRFMQLKKHNLLWVFASDVDNHQINFTDAGVELAKQHGIEIQ
jgi:hypothetical protein